MRRWGPSIVVTLAALAVLTAPSADAAPLKARPATLTEETAPRKAGEPIMAIVSIKSQQVTFYDADGWILRAPVSTGVKGRETPAGVFAVIEKDKDHHSTMYDDAWMPNMQRITWNGLALHGGPLPGYAASHGCVRMPFGFAEEMFDRTRIGMRVIISPNDAAPVEFSHPALLAPDAEAIAAAPSRAETLALEAAAAVEATRTAKKALATAAREAKSAVALVRKLELLKTRTVAQLVSADKALAAADQAKARAVDLEQKAAAKATELVPQLDAAKADAKAKADALVAANAAVKATADALAAANDAAKANPDAPAAASDATKAEADALAAATDAANMNDKAKEAAAIAVREAKAAAALVRELEQLKTRADAELASADKGLVAADRARTRAMDLQQKATAKFAELATELDAAKADAKAKVDAAAAAVEAGKAAETEKAAAAGAAIEAKLLLEPVSIYISRATQKLYVRRNTHTPAPDGGGEVFDSTIEVPITIRDPEIPIGTHVFTAMAPSDGGLRWTAVTIDDADDATDALDRVTIPQDVLDRIAPTALPRSSIIISDEPLSKETNYRTEFVAVLSNQPQGGFLTRRPTVNVAVKQILFARWPGSASFPFFSATRTFKVPARADRRRSRCRWYRRPLAIPTRGSPRPRPARCGRRESSQGGHSHQRRHRCTPRSRPGAGLAFRAGETRGGSDALEPVTGGMLRSATQLLEFATRERHQRT